MGVISIANTKGGAGKTTVALLLAMEFAQKGERVVILDCDPLAFASHWHRAAGQAGNISLIGNVAFANLAAHLKGQQAHADHLIIDLSGARDALIALAAGFSDLVLIPLQGCAMDARGAAHVLDLVSQVESNARGHINHAVVLTRVSACVTTRALRNVRAALAHRNVAVLDTPIIERSAYREVFEQGDTLYTLDKSAASNLESARRNMSALALEVRARLSSNLATQSNGPFAKICYQALPAGQRQLRPADARSSAPWQIGQPHAGR